MSRGEYRPIHTVLVDSPEFQDLSPHARLLLYTVKMSLGPTGIGVLYEDQLRHRSGLSREEVVAARQELMAGDWIRIEGVVYWLRNGLKFEPTTSLKNENHRKWIAKEIGGLPKLPIVNEFARYYGLNTPFPEIVSEGDTEGDAQGHQNEGDPDGIPDPSPPIPSQEPPIPGGGLDKLLDYLPESAHESVRAVATTVRNNRTWAVGLMGQYGPNGTEERVMAGVPKDERPEVLAVALQRLAAEGQEYRGNFFRGIVEGVIRSRQPKGPDFGDETARDAERMASYRQRETERKREEWDESEAEAEAEMAALWEWWYDLDPERRQEIEAEGKKRAGAVPPQARKPIMIGVMVEHKQAEEARAS